MNTITRSALVTILAVPLLLAACGDDDTDAASPDVPTESGNDGYVAAGTAICADAAPRIVEAFPDPDGEPDIEYLREIAGPIADVMADVRADFAAMEPPTSAQVGHERLLEEIDIAVDELRTVLDDDVAADAMLESGPPLDGPAEAALDLGFQGCG